MKPEEINIIVGCEESQAITLAFRALGLSAFSCDLKPCSGGHPEWHYQQDIFKTLTTGGPWHMAFFNPDCTYLTVTANKWLKDQPARKSGALVGQARRDAQAAGVRFAERLWETNIPLIGIENPIGVLSTKSKLGKATQIIQPFQFGHPEPKKTCLWLKGLPVLKHTELVEPEYHTTESGKRMPLWYAYADKSQGQAHRAEIRSKTFPGIAKAMANQWGKFLLNYYELI